MYSLKNNNSDKIKSNNHSDTGKNKINIEHLKIKG